jgi:hypothetical protein
LGINTAGTTDISQAEAIDNLCAKIAEMIHGDEPEAIRSRGPPAHSAAVQAFAKVKLTLISFSHGA